MRVVQCVCWWHLISQHKPREDAECLIANCNADNAFHIALHEGFNIPYMLKMHESMVHYV